MIFATTKAACWPGQEQSLMNCSRGVGCEHGGETAAMLRCTANVSRLSTRTKWREIHRPHRKDGEEISKLLQWTLSPEGRTAGRPTFMYHYVSDSCKTLIGVLSICRRPSECIHNTMILLLFPIRTRTDLHLQINTTEVGIETFLYIMIRLLVNLATNPPAGFHWK